MCLKFVSSLLVENGRSFKEILQSYEIIEFGLKNSYSFRKTFSKAEGTVPYTDLIFFTVSGVVTWQGGVGRRKVYFVNLENFLELCIFYS